MRASAALPLLVLVASVRHLDRFKDGVHQWLWFGIVGLIAVALTAVLPVLLRAPAAAGGDVAPGAAVARLGYRLALVGSSLMRASDPAAALAAFVAAGRAAAQPGAVEHSRCS